MPDFGYFRDEPVIAQWFAGFFITSLLWMYIVYLKTCKVLDKNEIDISFRQASLIYISFQCLYAIISCCLCDNQIVGTFNSTTGLALHAVLFFPILLEDTLYSYKKGVNVNIFLIVLVFLTVLATECRTAIVSIICVAAILFQCKYSFVKHLIITATVAVACVIFLLSSYKSDSTNGRVFILRNSIELICQKPITGYVNDGGYKKVYMEKQASYFKTNPESRYSMLADDIKHPLNEFVYLWINYGVGGALLLFLMLFFPIIVFSVKKERIGLCIISIIGVFSLFSYPLQYPLPCIMLLSCNLIAMLYIWPHDICMTKYKRGLLVTATVIFVILQINLTYHFSYYYRWNKAAHVALFKGGGEILDEFEKLYSYFSKNTYFQYNYMSELYHAGKYKKAFEVSQKLQTQLSSYNFMLLTGDILFHIGKYNASVGYYEKALMMCPNRFVPLYKQFKIYKKCHNIDKMKEIGREILSKKIKVPSSKINFIISDVKRDLDTHACK